MSDAIQATKTMLGQRAIDLARLRRAVALRCEALHDPQRRSYSALAHLSGARSNMILRLAIQVGSKMRVMNTTEAGDDTDGS